MNKESIEAVISEILIHDDADAITEFIMALLKSNEAAQDWVKEYIGNIDDHLLEFLDDDFVLFEK